MLTREDVIGMLRSRNGAVVVHEELVGREYTFMFRKSDRDYYAERKRFQDWLATLPNITKCAVEHRGTHIVIINGDY